MGRGLEALWRAIALRQMTPKARSRAAGLVCTKCGSVALNKLLLHYIIAPLPPYFLLSSSSPSSMPRPPATVGGCLMRLVREDGWEICPRGLGNGEE